MFFYVPGIMKKNRPSGLLKVICLEHKLNDVLNFVFKNTLSLGIRLTKTKRVKLDRHSCSISTSSGDLNLKEFKFKNSSYKRPEFESIKKDRRKKRICLL